jgi:CubicO group peptidase (beta-lactamase class C family)
MPNGYPAGFKDTDLRFNRTLKDLVAAIAKTPLESQPGEVWRYTGAGMATLGRIMEVLSGQSYADYLAARIFVPLGMKDSFFFVPKDRRARIASVYTDDHGVLRKADVNLYREGSIYPAPDGGLYSTAPDYFRFYQMLMNRGTLDGNRVLSASAVELMTTNHTGELKAGFAPGLGYGFGLCVVRSVEGMFRGNSIGTFSHGGSWRTYAFGDPKKDLVGIIMYQRTNGGGDVAEETTAFIRMANAAIE